MAGMTLGITEVHGDGTIHGTTEDGTEDGMTLGITEDTGAAIGAGMTHGIIHITLITDGMTHIGDISITARDTGMTETDTTRTYGTDPATRQALKGYLPAEHLSEAV